MKLYRVTLTLLVMVSLSSSAMAGPLARLFINPGNMTLCQGDKQKFSVFGTDSDDKIVPLTGTVIWSCNPTAGAITSDGLFTAGPTSGAYLQGVTATVGSMSAFAIVKVVPIVLQTKIVFDRSWGCENPGRLAGPKHSAIDADGNIYAPDGHLIQKFDSAGNFVGILGFDHGDEYYPLGSIAVCGSAMYTAQGGILLKRNLNGDIVGQIGGDWQFQGLTDIAVDTRGNIYGLEQICSQIQKFDSSGTFILKWSVNIMYDNYTSAKAISVDSVGNVYVTDTHNCRVLKFDPNGKLLRSWGTMGSLDGQFSSLTDIEVGPGDIVYTSDLDNGIQKFTTSGVYLGRLNISADSINVDRAGNIIVSSTYKYDPSGNLIGTWGSIRNGLLQQPRWIATTSDGSVYMADTGGNCIQKFDESGSFITKWPVSSPSSLCIMPNGNILAGSESNDTTEYTTTGILVSGWGTGPTQCVLALPDGTVYVVENSNTIRGYDSPGHQFVSWVPGTGTGGMEPQRTCLRWCSTDNNLYLICDSNRILVFDRFGKSVKNLSIVEGIALRGFDFSPDGNIYASDGEYISILSPTGSLIARCGPEQGSYYPVFGPCGKLYAADEVHGQAQKYLVATNSASVVKQMKDGELAVLSGLISTATSTEMGNCFYAESPDRSSGLKITKKSCTRGKSITATGFMATVDGEKELQANSLTIIAATAPEPFALTNKSLGGGDFSFDSITGAGQRGVEDGVGLNNIGLLVRTTGKVTVVGDDFFYIDDGTHARDASIFNGIRVKCGQLTKPSVGKQVTVTGISSIAKIGDRYFRSIRPRVSTDIVIL